jgi:hypothetical protein
VSGKTDIVSHRETHKLEEMVKRERGVLRERCELLEAQESTVAVEGDA